MSRNRLGELLVREKRISLEQLREAQKHQKDDNISLGYALARLGAISDQEITDFLSEQYRVQSIDLSEYDIDREILKLISPQVCERHKIIPVSRAGSSLIVGHGDDQRRACPVDRNIGIAPSTAQRSAQESRRRR